jgi:hypothetical protein
MSNLSISNFRKFLAAMSVLMLAGLSGNAQAAFGTSKDWPCIQREMPKISAGMVWTGDPVDAKDRSWTKMPKVAEAVQQVISRRKNIDEVHDAIDAFAANLKEDRTEALRALFVGALQKINAERRHIMGGIKRYSRRQSALADQIREKSLREEELLRKKSTLNDEEKQKLSELSDEVKWDTRIYEERERSLTYVCETPVMLEQRLFQIGRHISSLIKK